MGAKGSKHTPVAQRSPDGWPHTPEQREARLARMREYMRDKRSNTEVRERERVYRSTPTVRARMNELSTQHKRNRRLVLNEIKMASGCADCGYARHPAALEFDHVRGVKLFEIGSKISVGWERIEAELAKCDVVCANCHAIRTADRRDEVDRGL